jgi:phage terminase large subunit-like protein
MTNLIVIEGTPPRKRKETRGQRNIRWIQDHCFVPEGKFIGQPFELAPWQKRDLLKIYDNPKGTRRAILSFGRKNGKTSLAACLLLLHTCGPEHLPNSQCYSTGQSREQAALIFGLATKMIRMSQELNDVCVIHDSKRALLVPELGVTYRALSADAHTAFGLSPVFVIHDELGQNKGPHWPLYEAVETATGAQEHPLSIIISTQAANDQALLSVLIDDALAGHDPRTVLSLYTAPVELDPFDIKTIKLANPALGNFLNRREVEAMASDAERMPAREGDYRNLVLNQRVESYMAFVSPAEWAACGGEPQDITGVPVYGGLDLSEARDLTALVLLGNVGGVWQMHSTFWLPEKNLADKARQDHVPYDLWAKRGILRTTIGATVSYEEVAQYIRDEIFTRYNISKIGFDRWHMAQLKPWLIKAGFNEMALEEKFVDFGQGTKSMAPALRTFEEAIANRKLNHGNNPILNMCAAHAVIEGNDTGKDSSNRKLSKKRSNGRIDGMVAAAMAFGVAPLGAAVDISALVG